MAPQIIGVKQLYTSLKQITEDSLAGKSFVVVKNSQPVFRIMPLKKVNKTQTKIKKKKYTLKDFEKLQFNSGEKNLSQNIDKIIYGV